MAAREKVGEPEFVAFVGIDWADQKHGWCLQAANSTKREGGELEDKPEVVEAWVSELCQRFGHGAIAVAVEQVRALWYTCWVSMSACICIRYRRRCRRACGKRCIRREPKMIREMRICCWICFCSTGTNYAV